MTESDDVAATLKRGLGLYGFGGDDPPPAVTAESTKPAKTAKRVEPVSEADKLKKRKQAAVFAEGFATPKLGKPGLLGLGV